MREIRMVLLAACLALPLVWSSRFSAKTPEEALNQMLMTTLVGVLPLLGTMLLFGEDFSGADIDVRYGRNRRMFAARKMLRVLVALTAASVLGSAACILAVRGIHHPSLLRDLFATWNVSVAGALSLGGFLGAARAWLGKIGLGVALALTWLLGPIDTIVSIVVPTGPIRVLIGAGAEYPFAGWVSLLLLYGVALVSTSLLLAKIPR